MVPHVDHRKDQSDNIAPPKIAYHTDVEPVWNWSRYARIQEAVCPWYDDARIGYSGLHPF